MVNVGLNLLKIHAEWLQIWRDFRKSEKTQRNMSIILSFVIFMFTFSYLLKIKNSNVKVCTFSFIFSIFFVFPNQSPLTRLTRSVGRVLRSRLSPWDLTSDSGQLSRRPHSRRLSLLSWKKYENNNKKSK